MAQSAQIDKVSNRHEALLQYMIANPTARLRELSAVFNMTPAWISTIVNSDAFKVKLAERQDEAFVEVTLPLRERLHGVATAAVDRLGDMIPVVNDPKTMLDIADKTLHRLGYAPSRSVPLAQSPAHQNNTQMNFYGKVDSDMIARARGLMKQSQERPALEQPVGGVGEPSTD